MFEPRIQRPSVDSAGQSTQSKAVVWMLPSNPGGGGTFGPVFVSYYFIIACGSNCRAIRRAPVSGARVHEESPKAIATSRH